jgi:hypothetical protein
MKLVTTFFAVTVALVLASQTFGQGGSNRVQPRPVTNGLPKVIKFEGKGMKSALTTSAVTKPRPSAPPQPLSPAVLLSLYTSLGTTGAPQTGEYVLLTPRQPYVADRGILEVQNTSLFSPEDNDIYFASGINSAIALFRIKPAAVGQTYLIDIAIQAYSSSFGTPAFHIVTPDQNENTVGFSKPGAQHLLLTFTSTNTEWQVIHLNSNGGDWFLHSCKVTLLK